MTSPLDEVRDFMLPRTPSKLIAYVSVLLIDTGGWDENSQANGRTLVKELCKMVP